MSMRAPLTPRQSQIYGMVVRGIRANGYSPTYQEIGDEIGISKVTVYECVQTIMSRGYLRQPEKHKHRGIEPIEPVIEKYVRGGRVVQHLDALYDYVKAKADGGCRDAADLIERITLPAGTGGGA